MANILVTGGAGFIGTELVKQLVKEHTVSAFDLTPGKVSGVDYYQVNLTDKDQVDNIVKRIQPDLIYHLGGRIRGTEEELYQNNVLGTRNLLEAYSGRVIFMSSGLVYQGQKAPYREDMALDTQDPMGRTKILCEELLLERKNVAVVRASVVYGSGQKGPMFISSLKEFLVQREGAFPMTLGEQKRDFLHVDDLTRALLILQREEFTGVYNIAFGESFPMRDVINIAQEITGNFPVDTSLPYRENELWDYAFDITKAKKELNWEPKIRLEEGLKETLLSS
ncbi:NAD(P)-dependent oxidoreductase [Candidatus Woesearchaeota archaeon]|nr:NAD(P)-dependent oxidoreductase [Candidatus Woesearchaeota archaeon]